MGKKTKNEAPNQFSPHLSNTQRDTNFPPKKCISENIKITKENIFVVVRPTNKNITKTTIKKMENHDSYAGFRRFFPQQVFVWGFFISFN